MTWLIVGGRGQLGRSLSLILGRKGIDYRSLSSESLDIRSLESCLYWSEQISPVVIVNAAAWTNVDGAEKSPSDAYEVNAVGALNLAIAAKSINATYVQISTDYVFSGTARTPWATDDLRSPISVYGRTKATAEQWVLENYSSKTYIFRTAWLYSPWGKNFVKTMIKLAKRNQQEVRVVDDQIGQPTSAIDLAEKIVDSIIEELPFGIFHATNGGQATWFEFAQEVFDLCGESHERVIPISSLSLKLIAPRPEYSVLSHNCWQQMGKSGKPLSPMRGWREALQNDFPEILHNVLKDMEV